METFLEKLANRQVLLWEENQAVVQVLTNHTSRSPALMRQLRYLWFMLDMRNISLRPRYIRSEENIYADGLARERQIGGCTLVCSLRWRSIGASPPLRGLPLQTTVR